MTPQLTPEQRDSIATALYGGRKLEAIKELREASGLGLKEAKEIVERLEAEFRQSHPERFVQPARKKFPVGLILIFLIVDAIIVLLFFLFRR
jgi:hypothetical protein